MHEKCQRLRAVLQGGYYKLTNYSPAQSIISYRAAANSRQAYSTTANGNDTDCQPAQGNQSEGQASQ